jgi:hypothetical protein
MHAQQDYVLVMHALSSFTMISPQRDGDRGLHYLFLDRDIKMKEILK